MIDTHIQCLRPLIPLRAATIIDMGCGAGSVVRRLAELGAKAIGIEADPNRLALARRQRVVKRERYVEAAADRVPLENSSADVVLFLFSLQPLDSDRQHRALAEAQRLLKPGGRLHVVEALAEGPYFQVMRLIEDQSESRKATLRTLADIPALGLRPVMSVRYDHTEAFSDYADFRQRMGAGPGNPVARPMGGAETGFAASPSAPRLYQFPLLPGQFRRCRRPSRSGQKSGRSAPLPHHRQTGIAQPPGSLAHLGRSGGGAGTRRGLRLGLVRLDRGADGVAVHRTRFR